MPLVCLPIAHALPICSVCLPFARSLCGGLAVCSTWPGPQLPPLRAALSVLARFLRWFAGRLACRLVCSIPVSRGAPGLVVAPAVGVCLNFSSLLPLTFHPLCARPWLPLSLLGVPCSRPALSHLLSRLVRPLRSRVAIAPGVFMFPVLRASARCSRPSNRASSLPGYSLTLAFFAAPIGFRFRPLLGCRPLFSSSFPQLRGLAAPVPVPSPATFPPPVRCVCAPRIYCHLSVSAAFALPFHHFCLPLFFFFFRLAIVWRWCLSVAVPARLRLFRLVWPMRRPASALRLVPVALFFCSSVFSCPSATLLVAPPFSALRPVFSCRCAAGSWLCSAFRLRFFSFSHLPPFAVSAHSLGWSASLVLLLLLRSLWWRYASEGCGRRRLTIYGLWPLWAPLNLQWVCFFAPPLSAHCCYSLLSAPSLLPTFPAFLPLRLSGPFSGACSSCFLISLLAGTFLALLFHRPLRRPLTCLLFRAFLVPSSHSRYASARRRSVLRSPSASLRLRVLSRSRPGRFCIPSCPRPPSYPLGSPPLPRCDALVPLLRLCSPPSCLLSRLGWLCGMSHELLLAPRLPCELSFSLHFHSAFPLLFPPALRLGSPVMCRLVNHPPLSLSLFSPSAVRAL